MNPTTTLLATLTFDGKRFDNHALDVDCVGELTAYKKLVLECAKELWRRDNPDRERLAKGFEERFMLQFSEITEGSAAVPLYRIETREQGELDLGQHDRAAIREFDQAAELIDEAVHAADKGERLPTTFPKNVIPLFRDFGKSLRDDETLFLQARHRDTPVSYTSRARRCLAEWSDAAYEDRVDVTGEVNMANVRGGAFELLLDANLPPVRGRFSETQEAQVLEALHDHRTAWLRVQGIGEFSRSDRLLRKFLSVDAVSVAPAAGQAFVEDAKPIWETIAEIGASAPDEAWAEVPSELSIRIPMSFRRPDSCSAKRWRCFEPIRTRNGV